LAGALRDLLNKIFWDSREDPSRYEVKFIHRGADQNMKTVTASKIRRVARSYFILGGGDEETLIPFHRIVEIFDVKEKRSVWASPRHHRGAEPEICVRRPPRRRRRKP
jgi:uncharacterized protein (UPF0248 family)